MSNELSEAYYKLALNNASGNDLSAAVKYAGKALAFDNGNAEAKQLLSLCLYERGEYGAAKRVSSPDMLNEFTSMGKLLKKSWNAAKAPVGKGNFRQAEKILAEFPHQSVRMLLIRGCLLMLAKRHAQAAKLFSEASAMDNGDERAKTYLTEAVRSIDNGGVYERFLRVAGNFTGRGRGGN